MQAREYFSLVSPTLQKAGCVDNQYIAVEIKPDIELEIEPDIEPKIEPKIKTASISIKIDEELKISLIINGSSIILSEIQEKIIITITCDNNSSATVEPCNQLIIGCKNAYKSKIIRSLSSAIKALPNFSSLTPFPITLLINDIINDLDILDSINRFETHVLEELEIFDDSTKYFTFQEMSNADKCALLSRFSKSEDNALEYIDSYDEDLYGEFADTAILDTSDKLCDHIMSKITETTETTETTKTTKTIKTIKTIKTTKTTTNIKMMSPFSLQELCDVAITRLIICLMYSISNTSFKDMTLDYTTSYYTALNVIILDDNDICDIVLKILPLVCCVPYSTFEHFITILQNLSVKTNANTNAKTNTVTDVEINIAKILTITRNVIKIINIAAELVNLDQSVCQNPESITTRPYDTYLRFQREIFTLNILIDVVTLYQPLLEYRFSKNMIANFNRSKKLLKSAQRNIKGLLFLSRRRSRDCTYLLYIWINNSHPDQLCSNSPLELLSMFDTIKRSHMPAWETAIMLCEIALEMYLRLSAINKLRFIYRLNRYMAECVQLRLKLVPILDAIDTEYCKKYMLCKVPHNDKYIVVVKNYILIICKEDKNIVIGITLFDSSLRLSDATFGPRKVFKNVRELKLQHKRECNDIINLCRHRVIAFI